jgi:hypothetical protein
LISTASFHDGRTTGALALSFKRHQLRDEGRHVVGRVLAVEQQPVEAGEAEDLGRDRVGERAPAADQRLAGTERRLNEFGKARYGSGDVMGCSGESGKDQSSLTPPAATTVAQRFCSRSKKVENSAGDIV